MQRDTVATRPLLYLVRCNFRGSASQEQEWNRWYSGPKTADMLAMPLFTSGRRYRSAGLDQAVRYAALWHLESPAALDTQRYRQRWGFADWRDHVVDWSRELLLPIAAVPWDVVPPDGPIVVTAFDSPAIDHRLLPDAVWCTSIGLDRTWPWVAIEAPVPTDLSRLDEGPGIAWRTLFQPVGSEAPGAPADLVERPA